MWALVNDEMKVFDSSCVIFMVAAVVTDRRTETTPGLLAYHPPLAKYDLWLYPACFACCAPSLSPPQAYLSVTDSNGASTTSDAVSIAVKACGQPPVAKLSGGSTISMSCTGTAKLDGK